MNLRTEKILRREDGSRVKICVELFEVSHQRMEYRFSVQTCGKGKRTWNDCVDFDDFRYRALSMSERREFEIAESMEIISREELLNAKLSLWESLRPNTYRSLKRERGKK